MKARFLRGSAVTLLTACLAFVPAARAVDPPPDGGYPNEITAEGEEALLANTSGFGHTAIGFHALHKLSGASGCTAIGSLAIAQTIDLFGVNTATGFQALFHNTTGVSNVAIGVNALMTLAADRFSDNNTAVGANALSGLFKNDDNCAVGSGALQAVVDTGGNVVLGYATMGASKDGDDNVAIGSSALLNGNGIRNVALGTQALVSLTDASGNNIAIGFGAGRKLVENSSNNIEVGTQGVKGDNATIRIGTAKTHKATFIAGISGVTVASGVGVVMDNNGQLGTLSSSARYKQAIKPMTTSSEVIYSLHPVTYRYKNTLDPAGIPQFGLVAEQVAKVAPELVAYDKEGKPYSVRYQAVNAMLLNEFQKNEQTAAAEDATLKIQQSKLDRLDAKIAQVEAELAE